MHNRTLADIIAGRDLLAAAPDTSVLDAARMMRDRNVGSILVMDGDTLLGIASERDMAFRLVAEGLDAASTAISAIMSADIHALPDQRVGLDAVRMMEHHHIRHVVVERQGGGYGVVSARDFSSAELAEGAKLHKQATDLWEHL